MMKPPPPPTPSPPPLRSSLSPPAGLSLPTLPLLLRLKHCSSLTSASKTLTHRPSLPPPSAYLEKLEGGYVDAVKILSSKSV